MAIVVCMNIEEAIARFIHYLRFVKRYSPHTIEGYGVDLQQFAGYLRDECQTEELAGVQVIFVRSWLADIKEQNKQVSARTINRKISTLKSFFRFLQKEKCLESNPMGAITSLKQNKRLPQFVEKEDIASLWQEGVFPGDWDGQTQKLVCLIFYHSGIRLSELLALKERDIDLYSGVMKVLGKGSKERLVPCSPLLLKEIKAYCGAKRKVLEVFDKDALLVLETGKPLPRHWVYKTVKKYLGQVSTIQKRSPHVLRHSFATHLMNEGAELNAVKELLGHSSLAATQVYTHNTIEKLKAVFEQAHPKA